MSALPSSPGERFHHLFTDMLAGSVGKALKDRIAVEFESERFSFGELETLANQIGRHMQHQGAKAGDVVALLFDRSIHAYASVLAISKIGCVFLPLDAGFPDDRIGFICEDSGAKFALTISFHSAKFASTNVVVIALDEAEEAYGKLASTAPTIADGPSDHDAICYIIYTSGTTGNPKGVPINHSSICNFLKVAAAEYGFEAEDRVYQSLTLAFDYSFEEIWVPLLCGSSLIPAPSGVNLLGSDLAQYLNERQVTAWCSVPTILSTIENDLPYIRLLIVSGEACPPDLIARWQTSERRLLNLYGPTETTVSATWKVLTADGNVTIGKPLPTYTAMILATDAPRLLNPGDEGEIALAGIGLSDGYLNREAETKRAFIPDFLTLRNNPGGLIYRTGDLGRVNEEGEIEFRGRVDTQVKIRGYRIELGEIETIAREHSGIGNLVVNPVEVERGNLELAAYFPAPKKNNTVDTAALQEALRDRLPAYLVPVYFEQLDEIPLLPSQKVDRKSLSLPSQSRMLESGKAFVEPAEGTETGLADQLASILKLERISADADFFDDLGANSLLMARYLGSVRKKLGFKKISMKLVYQHTSVRELAEALGPIADTASGDFVKAEPQKVQVSRVETIVRDMADADRSFTTTTPPTTPTLPSNGDDIPSVPAGCFSENSKPRPEVAVESPVGHRQDGADVHVVPTAQYIACGIAQLVWMFLLVFVASSAGLILLKWLLAADGFWETYSRAATGSVSLFLGASALLIAVKWVAIGRFYEEIIPVWTTRYLLFWIAQTAIRINPMVLFTGTPVYNVFLRLLGANVGTGTLIFSPPPICTDLVSIGDNTVIRQQSTFHGYSARDGRLHLGSVRIGSNSYLGEATVMDINSELGDDAQLGNRSALHEGQTAAGSKEHHGSPAIVGATDFVRVPVEDVSPARAWVYTLSQFLYGMLISGPLVTALALIVVQTVFTSQTITSAATAKAINLPHTLGLSLAFYIGAIMIGLTSVSIMPKVWNFFFRPEEVHKLFGFQYFLAQRITATSNNQFLQALFGDSSLIVPYFKSVGYDLRNLTQNGSNFGIQQNHHSPFLCSFNNNTLVSDGLFMINMDLSRTSFKMSPISVPKDAYLGNDLHYPPGAMVGENCLIATKAMVPIDGNMRINVGVLGSPPFEIPRNKERDGRLDHYKQEGIFERRLWLKLKSNLVTLAWFMLRNWSMVFIGLAASSWLYESLGSVIFSNSLIGGGAIASLGLTLLVFRSFYNIVYERIANWYRPMKPRICSLYERPFWDHERFWKLNHDPVRDIMFNGTPIKNLVSICQGVKLGKQVFDDGCGITEPFLVTVGDYCTLNYRTTMQSHSLEDGTFKCDAIMIGDRCTLGVEAFVHYGTDIGNDVDIRTDAFVMKGSIVADNEIWSGNPAQQMTDEQKFN